jgi:hypothetical protein
MAARKFFVGGNWKCVSIPPSTSRLTIQIPDEPETLLMSDEAWV